MAEAPPRLLTVAQAAAYLQVNADTIRRWCRLGTLRCINLGDRAGYRIRQEDIDKFLADRQSAMTPQPPRSAADPQPGDKVSLWLDAEVAEVCGVALIEGQWVFHVLRLVDGTHIAMTPGALDAHTSKYEG